MVKAYHGCWRRSDLGFHAACIKEVHVRLISGDARLIESHELLPPKLKKLRLVLSIKPNVLILVSLRYIQAYK